MEQLDYKNFYDQVGRLNGWDFSKIRCISEGVKWDFYSEVAQRCKKSDILLDIGTGGGEALLSITEFALLLVGIDHATGMIQTAHANLTRSKKERSCRKAAFCLPTGRFVQQFASELKELSG